MSKVAISAKDISELRTRTSAGISDCKAALEEAQGDMDKAVEILRKDDNPLMVDVITCDIRMPKVNGIEAIAFFRKEFPSIPVVVITGFPETEMAVSLLKQGVSDYVPKPVESQKLLAIVAKAMEQRISLK